MRAYFCIVALSWITLVATSLGPYSSHAASCVTDQKSYPTFLNFRQIQAGETRRVEPLNCDPEETQITGTEKFSNGVLTLQFKNVVRIEYREIGAPENAVRPVCTGLLVSTSPHEEINLKNTKVITAAHCSCGVIGSYRFQRLQNSRTRLEVYVPRKSPSRFANYSCKAPPELQPGRDIAIFDVESIQSREENRSENYSTLYRFPKDGSGTVEEKIARPGLLIVNMNEVANDKSTKRLLGVGFGKTEDQILPDFPHQAAIDIASYFCVTGRFASSRCAPFREFVLADNSTLSGEAKRDSCGGDSGAPIFWQAPPLAEIDGTNGRVKKTKISAKGLPIALVGITSRGLQGVRHQAGFRCGGGGIYTSIGHPEVVAWLNQQGVKTIEEFTHIDN